MKKPGWLAVVFFLMLAVAGAEQGFKDGPQVVYPRGGDSGDGRTGFGWQVAYAWSPYFSAELALARHKDRVDEQRELPVPSSAFELEAVSLALSARVGYPVGPLRLYGAGGFGYYFLRGDAGDINRWTPADMRVGIDLENVWGYHAALGAEWRLNPRWELFAEYRWVYLDSDLTYRVTTSRLGADGVMQRGTQRITDDFPYDHGLIRAGVNYCF